MSAPHSFWTLGLVRVAVPWGALPLGAWLAYSFLLVQQQAIVQG